MHKKQEKHWKYRRRKTVGERDGDSHPPHILNDNYIITFKIWLFDYKKFKMKTDEFPFKAKARKKNEKQQRRKNTKREKLFQKRNIWKAISAARRV